MSLEEDNIDKLLLLSDEEEVQEEEENSDAIKEAPSRVNNVLISGHVSYISPLFQFYFRTLLYFPLLIQV